MADSKRTKLNGGDERINSYPMAADAVIFIGDLVMIDANGDATQGATATGQIGAGIAVEAKDNTGGAAGDKHIHVSDAPHAVELEAGVMTNANIGDAVYIVDDKIVDGDDGGATRSQYGTLVYVDADGVLFAKPTAAIS